MSTQKLFHLRRMELDRPCSRQEALGFRLSPAFYAHHLLVAFSMHAFRLVPMCREYYRLRMWSLHMRYCYRPWVGGSVCIEAGSNVIVESVPITLSPTPAAAGCSEVLLMWLSRSGSDVLVFF
jgi:hypothetical protein